MHSSTTSPQFSRCCQKRFVVMALHLEPPMLFCNILTARDLASSRIKSNIRGYNITWAMGYIKADWVSCGSKSSSFHATKLFMGASTNFYELQFLHVAFAHYFYQAISTTQTTTSKKVPMQLKCKTQMLHYFNNSLQRSTPDMRISSLL